MNPPRRVVSPGDVPPDLRGLRERILSLGPWHHDVEVAPGVRTGEPPPAGIYPPELGAPSLVRPADALARLVGEVYPEGLAGRSVLDCACNAGGYLFAARQLGAGRCFGFDVREHWIKQARFLAEHLPAENVEFATLDLASLPERRLGQFDITLFSGIFYHLPDPVAGLRIAANHTRELLVLNTAILPGGGCGDALVLSPESATEVMSGVYGLAWVPTGERVLREILGWCGFPHARLRYEGPAAGERRRVEILAARDTGTFARYDAGRPGQKASHSPERGGRLRRLARLAPERLRRAFRKV